MERIEYLDRENHPALPIDRIGKWGAYVSIEREGIVRSVAADFDTEEAAKAELPNMRSMAEKAIESALRFPNDGPIRVRI